MLGGLADREKIVLKGVEALGQQPLGDGERPEPECSLARRWRQRPVAPTRSQGVGVANHADGIVEEVFLDFGIVNPSPEGGDFGLEPTTEFRNGARDFHIEV